MLKSTQEGILEACGAKEQHVRGADRHISLLFFKAHMPSLFLKMALS